MLGKNQITLLNNNIGPNYELDVVDIAFKNGEVPKCKRKQIKSTLEASLITVLRLSLYHYIFNSIVYGKIDSTL